MKITTTLTKEELLHTKSWLGKKLDPSKRQALLLKRINYLLENHKYVS